MKKQPKPALQQTDVLSSFPALECPMCGRVCKPVAYDQKLGTKYEVHKCIPNDQNSLQPLAATGKRGFRINPNGDIVMKGLYNGVGNIA